jgi:hypothetical protein
MAFVATTLKVYSAPLTRPVTMQEVAPVVVQARPLGPEAFAT